MAESDMSEAAKKQLADEKKVRDASYAQYLEKQKGKPTPTQDENDRVRLGEHIESLEADGSDPDEGMVVGGSGAKKETKTAEAKPAQAGYTTRASRASE